MGAGGHVLVVAAIDRACEMRRGPSADDKWLGVDLATDATSGAG
jgi:hypothetical protein